MGLLVGLTGGMGTGKTTAAEIFRQLGAHVIDADAICRDLARPDLPAWREIVAAFGVGILTQPGRELDRGALARIVFVDAGQRRRLEAILHPKVFEVERQTADKVFARDPRAIVIVDAALLIESGNYKAMDKVIVVRCEASAQFSRLKRRSAWSDEEIRQRLDCQMPLEEKVRLADYVLNNDTTPESLREQAVQLYARLKEQAGR